MTQGPPAWHADPSGRHQHRWWDGLGYTDQVADNGIVTTDATATPLTAATPDRPGKAIALFVGAFVLLGLIGAVVYFVLGGDDGTTGTGTFEGTIGGGDVVGVHRVGVHGVTALTVELDPDDGLDAVVGVVVSRDDADRIEDLNRSIEALSLEEAFPVDTDLPDDDQVVVRVDVGFAGDEEQALLVVPFDVDLRVVVAPFDTADDGEGDYEIEIEAYPLDADEDDDIEDLLEAVVDDQDVPRDFRELAEEQLAFS